MGNTLLSERNRLCLQELHATSLWAASATGFAAAITTLILVGGAFVVPLLDGRGHETGRAVITVLLVFTPAIVVLAALFLLLPMLVVLSAWVLLAQRGVVNDASWRSLCVGAAAAAAPAAVLVVRLANEGGGAVEQFGATAMLAMIAFTAMLLPRRAVSGLPPGRFSKR